MRPAHEKGRRVRCQLTTRLGYQKDSSSGPSPLGRKSLTCYDNAIVPKTTVVTYVVCSYLLAAVGTLIYLFFGALVSWGDPCYMSDHPCSVTTDIVQSLAPIVLGLLALSFQVWFFRSTSPVHETGPSCFRRSTKGARGSQLHAELAIGFHDIQELLAGHYDLQPFGVDVTGNKSWLNFSSYRDG
jgi:hypothetical protein